MNSIDRHLKRWIVASFIQTFRPLQEQGFVLFVEGDDRPKDNARRIELRIDGPYTRPNGSRGEYCSYIEVNLLGNIPRDESNRYSRENLQGLMAFILNRDVCILRTGNVGKVPEDDESVLGIMQLLPHDAIKTSDFGMIDSNTEVYQSVSEAHYEMYYQTL